MVIYKDLWINTTLSLPNYSIPFVEKKIILSRVIFNELKNMLRVRYTSDAILKYVRMMLIAD